MTNCLPFTMQRCTFSKPDLNRVSLRCTGSTLSDSSPSVALLSQGGRYAPRGLPPAAPRLLQEKKLFAIFLFISPRQFTPHPSQHVPPLGNFCPLPSETGLALEQVRLPGSPLRRGGQLAAPGPRSFTRPAAGRGAAAVRPSWLGTEGREATRSPRQSSAAEPGAGGERRRELSSPHGPWRRLGCRSQMAARGEEAAPSAARRSAARPRGGEGAGSRRRDRRKGRSRVPGGSMGGG